MRLAWRRRLYYCARCDSEMFLTRQHLHALIGGESGHAASSMAPRGAHDASLLGQVNPSPRS
jgi:hypothetical protein